MIYMIAFLIYVQDYQGLSMGLSCGLFDWLFKQFNTYYFSWSVLRCALPFFRHNRVIIDRKQTGMTVIIFKITVFNHTYNCTRITSNIIHTIFLTYEVKLLSLAEILTLYNCI